MRDTPDPYSPEARDPFHIPGREMELVYFGATAFMSPMILYTLAVLSWDALFLITIAMTIGTTMFMFSSGLSARRHRLKRQAEVARLRAAILEPL